MAAYGKFQAGSEVVGDNAASPTKDLIAYIASTSSDRVRHRLAFVDSSGHPYYETVSPPLDFKATGFGGNGVLAWAPDGKRLAVVVQGTETPSIWIVEPESNTPYRKVLEFAGGPRIRGVIWTRGGDAIIIGNHDVAASDIVMLESAN